MSGMPTESKSEFDKLAAIVGKPGLYVLEGASPRGFVLRPLTGGPLVFVSVGSKKVMLLKDMALYTYEDTIPLRDVFIRMYEKAEEVPVPAPNEPPERLFAYLEQVVPEYDRERVKPRDVQKLVRWYHVLVEHDLIPTPADTQSAESSSQEQGSAEKTDDQEAQAGTQQEGADSNSKEPTAKKKSRRQSPARKKKEE